MNKTLFLALATALCCAAPMPAYSAGSAAAPERATPSAHIAYMRVFLNNLDSINALLSTVKDKESAEAAAPALKHLLSALRALGKTATELGETAHTTPADEREVRAMERQYQTKVTEFEKLIKELPTSMNSEAFDGALQILK